MAYQITSEDWKLLTQPGDLIIAQKLKVLDDNLLVLRELDGVISNVNISENAESAARKTTSFTVVPTWHSHIDVNEESLIWLNKSLEIQIGILNRRTNEYKWYDQGLYYFTDTSSTFDEVTNQLTVNCGDWWIKLDGTKNGQMSALTTTIPAYEEDEEGNPTKYNIIRDAIIKTAVQLGRIERYQIDDFGEYYAMPQNNADYEAYRKKNDLWNAVPYDLEFSVGCNVADILIQLRDLYPNYELYFDKDILMGGMIPSNEYDPVLVSDAQLQSVLISEGTSTPLTVVRNVCEVWGQVLEVDFFTDKNVTASGSVYNVTLESYEEYMTGDKIGIKVPKANVKGQKININSLGEQTIYNPDTEDPIDAGKMEAGKIYVLQFKRARVEGEDITKMYLLGQYQVHAIDVLTGVVDSSHPYTGLDGKVYKSYDQLISYFKTTHQCDEVHLTIIPDSPFTIQKIGEIIDVKHDSEFSQIYSDSLAVSRAIYENWKNCRLTDNITLTTLALPFLQTNIKVEYKKKNQDEVHQYIVKSISTDYEGFTSTITMMRFYPLYNEETEV